MATAKNANVMQKLAQARLMFLQKHVTKSGKNMKLEFLFFELKDIVPPALEIFAELGLLGVPQFNSEEAVMTIYNTDNLEEKGIEFTIPYRELDPILNREGKEVTNRVQSLGATITYLRRYLYMLALDIIEQDEIDATLGNNDTSEIKKPTKTRKRPATETERKAAKKQLTSNDGIATDEQITELKALCKKLRTIDESQDDFIQRIAQKTKGFTTITTSACTALNQNLKTMIEQYPVEE